MNPAVKGIRVVVDIIGGVIEEFPRVECVNFETLLVELGDPLAVQLINSVFSEVRRYEADPNFAAMGSACFGRIF